MINISKYNSYKLNEDNLKKQIFKFNKLNLKTQLLKGMIRFGIYFLTTIQKLSLLSILDGRDVMLSSQSGSGKTTCYAIGLINSHIGDVIKDNQVQLNYLKKSLIIAPTRELALQITTLVKSLSVYTLISIRKYIGGTSHLSNILQFSK
jgi:superfamily II DNA/RNA helicase